MSGGLKAKCPAPKKGQEVNTPSLSWLWCVRWELQNDAKNNDEENPKYAVILSCQNILSFGAS